MKNSFKIIFLIILLLLTIGCEKVDYEVIVSDALSSLSFPEKVDSDISFPEYVSLGEYKVDLKWSTSSSAISETGKVTRLDNDESVEIIVRASIEDYYVEKTIAVVTVLKKESSTDYKAIFEEIKSLIFIPESTDKDIDLPSELVTSSNEKVTLTWSSSSKEIDGEGKVVLGDEEVEVTLSCTVSFQEEKEVFTYKVKVSAKSIEETDYNKIFDEVINKINIDENISSDLDLKDSYTINNVIVSVKYIMSNDALSERGVTYPDSEEDKTVDISVLLTASSQEREVSLGSFTVLSLKNIAINASKKITVPEIIDDDIELVTDIDGVEVQWGCDSYYLSNDGKYKYTSERINEKLRALLYIEKNDQEYFYDLEFDIVIAPYKTEKRFLMASEKISIPTKTKDNLNLETEFKYDVTGSWVSSNTDVISNTGIVIRGSEDVSVTLTLTLKCEDEEHEIVFNTIVSKLEVGEGEVYFSGHNLIDRASTFNSSNMNNVVLNNGRLELSDSAITGTYESNIFSTLNFDQLVGSYSCITDINATCEFEVSVYVNGTWSKYFTYGKWGLGRTNYYYNDSDSVAKISTDEVIVNTGTASKVKYRITLERTNVSVNSPSFSLAAFALNIPNYVYKVDTTNLPNECDHDLPKLYQHDVPVIGGSICSATTTTMLLKNKGFDFSSKGYQYEHEYIANMVADPGHNNPTYGNWSYNMITAGAFGVDAYVARMYSWDEVREHLVNVGPMGASIKGTFGSYTTNGHLIVVRGYRIENGKTTVICNDPNIKGVYYEVTLETFLNCWRGVSYVVL